MCFRPADAQAATKTCPECGASNGYFDEVCAECGADLPKSGPSMGGAPGAPGAPGRPGAPMAPGVPGVPGVPGAK